VAGNHLDDHQLLDLAMGQAPPSTRTTPGGITATGARIAGSDWNPYVRWRRGWSRLAR